MKSLLTGIITMFFLFNSNCQTSMIEYDLRDTSWKEDINIGILNFVEFQKLIPQFITDENISILESLDKDVLNTLSKVDSIYGQEVNRFKNNYSEIAIQREEKRRGFAHLDFMIELEKFHFYPNIYGIIVNSNRLTIYPKIDTNTRQYFISLINEVDLQLREKSTPEKKKLSEISIKFKEQFPQKFHRINQGDLSVEEKEKYEFIDFLILLNRYRNEE